MYDDFEKNSNKAQREFFESKVKKVLIVIAYKKWNKKLVNLYVDEKWELFVITKDFFQKLYGPTLNRLAQFFYNPCILKEK